MRKVSIFPDHKTSSLLHERQKIQLGNVLLRFRTSRIPLDVWRDSFLGLDRFSLDACQICTRSFRSLLDEFAPDICRRQLREADIRYRAADLCGNGTAGFSAALFATDDHSVHVTEKDIQSFKRKLKKVAGQSRIDSIDINGKMPADKLNEFVEASEEIFSGIQASDKAVGLCCVRISDNRYG